MLSNAWIDGWEGKAPAEPGHWFRLGRSLALPNLPDILALIAL